MAESRVRVPPAEEVRCTGRGDLIDGELVIAFVALRSRRGIAAGPIESALKRPPIQADRRLEEIGIDWTHV